MRAYLVLAALSVAGCGTANHAAIPLVRVHAANDLDCPDADIQIEEELGGFKAVGCGRKAHYRASCDGLSCVVSGEDEPSIPWHDRPEPGDPRFR